MSRMKHMRASESSVQFFNYCLGLLVLLVTTN